MSASGEISTWHLKCYTDHFEDQEHKELYLRNFEWFLKSIAKTAYQEQAFEMDEAENCPQDDDEPPAIRVCLLQPIPIQRLHRSRSVISHDQNVRFLSFA
jgi:hypothetical protein